MEKAPIPPLRLGPLTIDPPILQAPMAGYTNYAYRQIIRRLGGVGLPATEMISARGFLELDARSDAFPDRLWGIKDEPRPLAVQIWDNDPGKLAAVGRRLAEEFGVSVVDLNFGCPVRDVAQKAQSGSYLLRDPEQVERIVARVAQACRPVPVTAKIRLGWDRQSISAAEVAEAVEQAGGAALTVHGRTAADAYRGTADWDQIARVKPHLRRIPLIGNGDLKTADDVMRAFRRFPVDGVMIGRAGLGRPWLFAQAAAALREEPVLAEPTLAAQRELLLEHYRLVVARFGPQGGTVLMRKFACHYAQAQPGARAFRRHIAGVKTPEEFNAAVEEHFPRECR